MFDRIMGRYLAEKGKITEDQLAGVYQTQDSKRAKLGVIAVAEKLMTVAQAEEINALQATMDKRFGDLATERGYLNNIQVGRLLSLQGDEFLVFTSAIVDRGIMTLQEVDDEIKNYQRENNLTDDELTALTHGDLDAVAAIYLDTKDPECISLFSYGIKNLYRLVDSHMSIGEAYTATDIGDDCVSYQSFSGDINATVAIIGKDKDLQRMAKSYTKEEFIETGEDALDAMCELINCINGLYATEKSRQGKRIELEPPVFHTKYSHISGEEIHVIPVYSCGGKVSLVVSVNHEVTVK